MLYGGGVGGSCTGGAATPRRSARPLPPLGDVRTAGRGESAISGAAAARVLVLGPDAASSSVQAPGAIDGWTACSMAAGRDSVVPAAWLAGRVPSCSTTSPGRCCTPGCGSAGRQLLLSLSDSGPSHAALALPAQLPDADERAPASTGAGAGPAAPAATAACRQSQDGMAWSWHRMQAQLQPPCVSLRPTPSRPA